MNAARIPVRGFQIEDCGLKKQVVKYVSFYTFQNFLILLVSFITLTLRASLYFSSVSLTGQFESSKNNVIGAVHKGRHYFRGGRGCLIKDA